MATMQMSMLCLLLAERQRGINSKRAMKHTIRRLKNNRRQTWYHELLLFLVGTLAMMSPATVSRSVWIRPRLINVYCSLNFSVRWKSNHDRDAFFGAGILIGGKE